MAYNGRTSGEILRISGLGKRFGGLKVFEGIDLELPAGGVRGVIGPNGAGKTTLINVICGMLSPSAGTVKIGDVEISGKAFDAVSQLGVLRSFQQTNTFRTASVEENLYRAAKFRANRDSKSLDVKTLLDEFGLSQHMHEPSESLPYGLQKMLGLVMVLVGKPKFLLLDEPAAGLERRERTQIDRFVDFARNSLDCGIMIVEHDMDLVRRLCPYIMVLEAGRLLAQGPPGEVLARRDVMDAYLGASED